MSNVAIMGAIGLAGAVFAFLGHLHCDRALRRETSPSEIGKLAAAFGQALGPPMVTAGVVGVGILLTS
jgi:hypothetical protein